MKVYIVIAIVLICGFVYAEPNVWLVHPDSALNSIQAGLDSCADNDIVLVCPGTYVENLVWPTTQGIHLISEQGPEVTIIDGDSIATVIHIDSMVDTTTVIRGFTIQNGYASQSGGGIYCHPNASPLITNNIITDNVAELSGGGIYIFISNPIIRDNMISANTAPGASAAGAGIHVIAGSPYIIGNTITQNSTPSQGTGGGICFGNNCHGITSGNIITENTAYQSGGIHLYMSTPEITDNEITGNIAMSVGGGIYCWNSSPTIRNNIITGNASYYNGGLWGGGIRIYNGSNPSIVKCIISDNQGSGIGCCLLSSPTIDSCTIAHNTWHGFWCQADTAPSHPVISECNIFDNDLYGVMNSQPADTVDARNNWWGDPSGPGGVGPGTGDEVSDNVLYDPWKTQPGVKENISQPVTKNTLGATIFQGPLLLPEGKQCRVFDITGRTVLPDKIKPGIYFIEIDGQVTQKVIKIR